LASVVDWRQNLNVVWRPRVADGLTGQATSGLSSAMEASTRVCEPPPAPHFPLLLRSPEAQQQGRNAPPLLPSKRRHTRACLPPQKREPQLDQSSAVSSSTSSPF